METSSTGSIRHVQDLPKEELVEMFLKVQLEKAAAIETCAQANLEKDKLKEKALVLLKRCRDLEAIVNNDTKASEVAAAVEETLKYKDQGTRIDQSHWVHKICTHGFLLNHRVRFRLSLFF